MTLTAQADALTAPVTTTVNTVGGVVNQVPVVNMVPATVGKLQRTPEGNLATRLIALPFNLAAKVISVPFSLFRHR